MYTTPMIRSSPSPPVDATTGIHTLSLAGTIPSSLPLPNLSFAIHNGGEYYEHHNIVKVLIPISVLGWVAFGAICILCINGHGRAGRWIPEWYLDSEGTRWDKAAVGAWWLTVIFGWPVILPIVVVGHFSRKVKMWRDGRRLRKGKEREAGLA